MQKLALGLAIGAACYGLGLLGLTPAQATVMGIIAFIVALWTNEGLPLGAVSLLPILLFPLFGVMGVTEVTPNYAHPIIFLFLGGFLLAIAVEKTGLHRYLALRILAVFPRTPYGLIYAITITSALLSGLLSNTTVTLMLMPIAALLSKSPEVRVRALLATAYGASIGGILTPIGTPPNLWLIGFLENHSLSPPDFIGWVIMMAPVVALMLAAAPPIIAHGIRDAHSEVEHQDPIEITGEQKKLLFILAALLCVLVANAKIEPFFSGLGWNEKLILLAFGLAMFFPGLRFLDWEDTKRVPYEILFLFGAGFSIAAAFGKSGIAPLLIAQFSGLENAPLIGLIFFTALAASFSTEVTSNTAFVSLSLPIFLQLVKEFGLDERLLYVVTAAASYAFMLPIATPPNAIVMSSGYISFSQMARTGFWVNMAGVAILSFSASLFW